MQIRFWFSICVYLRPEFFIGFRRVLYGPAGPAATSVRFNNDVAELHFAGLIKERSFPPTPPPASTTRLPLPAASRSLDESGSAAVRPSRHPHPANARASLRASAPFPQCALPSTQTRGDPDRRASSSPHSPARAIPSEL